ncbi:MAG: hypothetical protein ACTSVZ_03870 [Promethearchaeota archaeon]
MGRVFGAKCKACGEKFDYSEGGGFNFAIIQCDSCFRSKDVSWEEKDSKLEHGSCSCGGIFRNDATVRCPKCSSPDIQNFGIKILFD